MRRSRSLSTGRLLAMAVPIGLSLAACAGGGSRDALEAVLAAEREAHLRADAAALAANIADTLVSVDDGRILLQTRAEVRARFQRYFEAADYAAWDDLEQPRISLSPDRRAATVHRRVRSERTEPAFGGKRREAVFESAWTATYVWVDGRWLMTSVASTFLPLPSAAEAVAAGARRRVGLAAERRTLRAVVEAEGPDGPFGVTIHSSPDGAARIDFDEGFSAAIAPNSQWSREGETVSDLEPAWETFVRGHELHLMLLQPSSRLANLRTAGQAVFEGTPALRLVGDDAMGSPVEVYYAAADTLPLGARLVDHVGIGTDPVLWLSEDWRAGSTGGPELARGATIRQGTEVFRYRYVSLEWLDPDPALFEPT